MTAQSRLEAAFRAAAEVLGAREPEDGSPADLRARLILQRVRRGTRWIDDALRAAAAVRPETSTDRPAERLLACCEGWVQRARGPFRPAAEAWLERVADAPDAVPGLLAYWRITGDERVLKRALAAVPETVSSVDIAAGEACWSAFQATADESLLQRARDAVPDDPGSVPVIGWPLMSHLYALTPDDFSGALDALEDAAPEDVVRAAGRLALPPLVVDVQWWYESDLFSGPVAEAATFPYPNTRLAFRRLPHAAQAVLTADLGGSATDPLEDIGVIAALLDDVVSRVDRTPLRDAPRRRRRPSRLLR